MEEFDLLDPKKNRVLTTPKYLKDHFRSLNYHPLPKNRIIKKIKLFIDLKLLRKLRIIINLLINGKLIFSKPPNFEYLIFDDVASEEVGKIMPTSIYFALPTRIEKFKNVYISKEIIFYLIKNFFRNSIKVNYLCCLIKIIKPKTVVTIADISLDFSLVSSILKNSGIKFLAIQDSYRQVEVLSKLHYLPNYLTYGNHEVGIIKKYNKNISKVKSVGSWKAAVAKDYFEKNNINLNEKKYDICLVSEAHFFLNQEYVGVKDIIENIGLVARYTLKFCKKFNKKIIFSGRADINSGNKKNGEKIFYRNQIKDQEFNISFPNRSKYENYRNLINSNLVIGSHSTILKEIFEFKKKILWCDWVDTTEFPSKGICVLKSKRYEDFEKKVLELLEINYQEYISKIDDIDSVYNTNVDTLNSLKQEIR